MLFNKLNNFIQQEFLHHLQQFYCSIYRKINNTVDETQNNVGAISDNSCGRTQIGNSKIVPELIEIAEQIVDDCFQFTNLTINPFCRCIQLMLLI